MNINKNNYEAFFLDYHEGNLSPQQVAELLLFVEEHHELKEEFESFENITLEEFSTITFKDKSDLKKEITIYNKEEYFIRSVENTLNITEKTLLDTFLKQHPQFLIEFELFQKTKLQADASIVFEDKEVLKKDLAPALSKGEKETASNLSEFDDLMIASVEELLTKQETVLLNQQLTVDAEMQHTLSLYKQTKLVTDTSIVYENKEELKRDLTPTLSKGEGEYGEKEDNRKVIPFYYYVAAAASVLLVIGLYFMFNTSKINQSNLADKINEVKTHPKEQPTNASTNVVKNNRVINNIENAHPQTAVVVRNKKSNSILKKNTIETPVIKNEQPIINVAENKQANKEQKGPENTSVPNNNQLPTLKNEQPVSTNTDALALNNNKNEIKKPADYLSLREFAAEKIKEKTLDENTLAMQKKNGHLKRFSGWDIAQIITKGLSKLTGRDLEVKPTYNAEGDVTAYALGSGAFEVSRGR